MSNKEAPLLPHLNIFLSYPVGAKNFATFIKGKLEIYGSTVFIAPDDVTVGTKFLASIYNKIKKCDIFIVLLSSDSSSSEYLDHEIGIAVGATKTIIPVCIDETEPYGFLRDLQGIHVSYTTINEQMDPLFRDILISTGVGTAYIDILVSKLTNADTYVKAMHWASSLKRYSHFTDKQMTNIAKARFANAEIYQSFMACPVVDELLEKYEEQLEPEIRKKFFKIKSKND